MSEQEKPKSFMQELDAWAHQVVISPLLDKGPEVEVIAEVQKAIREKVLQSYRNGQAAGPRPAAKPRKEFRR